MDVCEAEQALLRKQRAEEILIRPPLVPAEKNNGVVATRRSRTREISSRYKSPSPSTPSVPRRFPSPSITRTVNAPSSLVPPKRAHSAERKRPSTPPSPPSPSTPVRDSSADIQLPARKVGSGRFPEGLWPSTMRSLSVSFQSDTISIPISKREKPVTHALSDRTLKSSSNVAHKQPETPAAPRKPTPERKRSPLKGKNLSDQSENSKPVDSLHARLVDQHRWPSRTGGKVSSNVLNRSTDLTDKTIRGSSTLQGIGLSSLRRVPISDGIGRPLQKSVSDVVSQLSFSKSGRVELEAYSADDNPRRLSGSNIPSLSSSAERTNGSITAARSHSMPIPGSRPSSPSKSSVLSSSLSRGVSPSRTRPSTPPNRGISPSRIRSTSTSSQSNSSTSVLSFIADFRKGKKGANQIEDVHQLRLLYNRYLQWRYTNARADAALDIQKETAERTLYNVWKATLSLWDSVIKKRINLQQLMLEFKLNAVLNKQMAYLDDWAILERDHASSLSGSIEDLEASTLRLPVTGGARADIETVKVAICSAVDVMQAMGSSLYSLLSRVEGMNSLVSGLADVVALERAMLGQCEALLASTAAMQVEEYSIRSHIIQFKQTCWTQNEQPTLLKSKCLYDPVQLHT